jgi:hypothetical protein
MGVALVGFFVTEAEAFPVGKPIAKIARKVAGKGLSSASSALKGMVIEGKVIKEVRAGQRNWRYLVFEDGSGRPVTKEFVHDLCQSGGTAKYMNKLQARPSEEKLMQAEKSLNYHLNRVYYDSPKYTQKPRRQRYLNRLGEVGQKSEEKPDLVGVWYNKIYLTMPRPYAELLERAGRLRIDKTKSGKFKR